MVQHVHRLDADGMALCRHRNVLHDVRLQGGAVPITKGVPTAKGVLITMGVPTTKGVPIAKVVPITIGVPRTKGVGFDGQEARRGRKQPTQ